MSSERGELPQHHAQQPITGWPDWYDPDQPQLVVGPTAVHVPDPTQPEPAPDCSPPYRDHVDYQVRAADTRPDPDYCDDCPWGEHDDA